VRKRGANEPPVPWWPQLVPWAIVLALGVPLYVYARDQLDDIRKGEELVWEHPKAAWLALAGGFVGWILFHLRRHHNAALAFTRVDTLRGVSRGWFAYLASLPGALRVLALVAIASALGRPHTYVTVTKSVDTIDIMLVLDLSKSMEEADMAPRINRFDAMLAVTRNFLADIHTDRVGLAIFAEGAMLQCPLTFDMVVLDNIVANLMIGDVPESGTAIGDGLAMGLGELKKSDAKSKVVLLLSDGDNNVVTAFTPEESAQLADDMNVKVFTVLAGAENSYFGGGGVNPETLSSIARVTGGEFFRATDSRELNRSFEAVRKKLAKTTRTMTERIPDKELFGTLLALGVFLLLAELVLTSTKFRRFP
jgi:Ca-activated chloride channel family protein